MNTRFHEAALATHNLCIQPVYGEEGVDNFFVNIHLGLTWFIHLARLVYGFPVALYRVCR